MQEEIDGHIEIKYIINSTISDYSDAEKYLTTIDAEIYKVNESGEKEAIGVAKIYKLNCINALNDDVDLFTLIDGIEESVSTTTLPMFDSNMEIKQKFLSPDFDYGIRDIIVIGKIALNKKGRGNKYGAKIIKDVEFVFGRDCIMALTPFPLQKSVDIDEKEHKEYGYGELPKNQKKSLDKLISIYSSYGYNYFKKENLFIKHLYD